MKCTPILPWRRRLQEQELHARFNQFAANKQFTVSPGLMSPDDLAAALGFNQEEFDGWQAAQPKAAAPASARCTTRLAGWLHSLAEALTRRANKRPQSLGS